MDSLSQIVLGAATGELVGGRKLGNRALWLGALGGTIPDLDVFGRFFLDPLANLAFHRGISHSMLFWVIGSVFFGELTLRISRRPILSRWQWWGFYFACFATHVLLDCFTMYGTQLWAPFADTRVAWSTIAVADPLYTVPFLLALVVLSRKAPGTSGRRFWHRFGWAWSLGYLALTLVNKIQVDQTFETSLHDQRIDVSRFVSNPTILNNLLWNATAESEDAFWLAQHSIFDAEPPVWHRLEKNQDWMDKWAGDPVLETLKWFSKGYLHLSPIDSSGHPSVFELNDLRFGSMRADGGPDDDLIFRFAVDVAPEGHLIFLRAEGGPREGEEMDFMPLLWQRMWGQPIR